MSSGATSTRRRRSSRKASLSTVISVRLTLSTGPELFAAVHSAPSASERIKQLATLGLAAERAGMALDALRPAVIASLAVPRDPPAASAITPRPRHVDREPTRSPPQEESSPSRSADLDAAMLGAQAFGFG